MGRMKTISSKEAREHLAEILNQVAYGSKKYTLTRHGNGVAVLISLEEWNEIEKLLEQREDAEDIRDADLAYKSYSKKKDAIPLKKVKKKLGL
jgi:prevent-host-death family protein